MQSTQPEKQAAQQSAPIDEAKLNAFMNQLFGDLGGTMTAAMVLIGDKLGLYKAMADGKPVTSAELAQKTGTTERYVREWLGNQAASGYVHYDAKTGTYDLPPEQVCALANEGGPAFFAGAFQLAAAIFAAVPKIIDNFKTGKGLDWCDHDHRLFEGTERFFRPGYAANLAQNWIPALDGVEAKLKAGAKVADVGCGLGASTIVMAQAFPNSRFHGFDYHAASIETARLRATQAGVTDRVVFEVAKATDYPGADYDFVAHFDCLHDMGDPKGAAAHVRKTLKKDGTWMIVEPFAGDKVEDNLNPVGRVFYAASTCICVPASLAQNGPALGAQAGEARLKEVVLQGGFTRFRRATQTPFNLVLEARP
ncbi:MAG TPA: methyltransferase domain-containing protein [Gemmataceae bacterium]|nr:methyltransferase domain-containing protein [Gemmataceae bacterium]